MLEQVRVLVQRAKEHRVQLLDLLLVDMLVLHGPLLDSLVKDLVIVPHLARIVLHEALHLKAFALLKLLHCLNQLENL